jgi:hypothetical protein
MMRKELYWYVCLAARPNQVRRSVEGSLSEELSSLGEAALVEGGARLEQLAKDEEARARQALDHATATMRASLQVS